MDYTLAEQIFYVYIVRIICGFGILGNTLNLTILARRTLSESPYTYLTAMTVSDLFVLMVIAGIGTVRCGYCVLTPEQKYKGHVYEVYAFLPLANIAASTSTFITIAIAIERFIFVRFPLLAKNLCNRRSARISLVAIFALSSTLNSSRFFLNKVTWNIVTPQNKTNVSYFLGFRCDDVLFDPYDKIILFGLQGAYNVSQQRTLNAMATNYSDIQSSESDQLFLLSYWHNATFAIVLTDGSTCLKNLSQIHPLIKNQSYGNCSEEIFPNISYGLLQEMLSLTKTAFRNCSSLYSCRIKEMVKNCSDPELPKIVDCGIQDALANRADEGEFHNYFYSNSGATIFILLCNAKSLECNAEESSLNTSVNSANDRRMCLYTNATNNSVDIIHVRIEATSFGRWAMDGYQIVVAITESLSFMLLVSFNVGLIIVLRRKHLKRQVMVASFRMARYSRRQHRDQQRLTMTLLTITCISAVTTFTNIVNSHPVSTRLFSPQYSKFFGLLGNLTLLLGNTINFLLYALINSRFRREFLLVYKVKLSEFFAWKPKYTVRSGLVTPTEIPLRITNAEL